MLPQLRIACVFLVLSSAAQNALRVDVQLVSVTTTVTDTAGRFLGHLTADDFILEEDGVPQKIAHFSRDHAIPVSVGILLDTSGSMEPKLETSTEAVERFIRIIHPDDDVFLMTFATRPALLQDFTHDRKKLSRALRTVRPKKGSLDFSNVLTSINDSLEAAIEKLRTSEHEKRAILLISDGQDTWSRETIDRLMKTIGRSEVLIYSLGIGGEPKKYPRDIVNMKTLDEFATGSGGRATLLTAPKPEELDKVLAEIANELRNQYSLAYYPSHPDDDHFHAIRVKTRDGYTVRARNGYWSGN